MAIYSKHRIGNELTITNISSENFIVNVQFDKYCCSNCGDCSDCNFVNLTLPSGGILIPGSHIHIHLDDGKYLVAIEKNNHIIDSFEYNIYEELKEEVITSVSDTFCDDCEECKKPKKCQQEKLDSFLNDQSSVEAILTYSLLKGYSNNAVFTNYLQSAFNYYKCDFVTTGLNQRNYLKYFGRHSDKYDLFGKFAMIYYIGFYLMEILEDTDNATALCVTFKINEIKTCLNKYGIMFNKLEDLFKSFLDFFTEKPVILNSDFYIDLPVTGETPQKLCIEDTAFLSANGTDIQYSVITSLPTSGNLFVTDFNTGEELPVELNKEYFTPFLPGNCTYKYTPTETSNSENPYDNFTFKVAGEEILLGLKAQSEYSEDGIISIHTRTLGGGDSSNQTLAEQYSPMGVNLATSIGIVPLVTDGISNKDAMPSGTTYTWQTTPDVSTVRILNATIVVTYMDGSIDKVNISITVKAGVTYSFTKGIYLNQTNRGTISGKENGVYAAGTAISISAVANNGFIFSGWRNVHTGVIVSTDASYSFGMPESNLTLEAVFTALSLDNYQFTAGIYQNLTAYGEITGTTANGMYSKNTQIILRATPKSGYKFKHWVGSLNLTTQILKTAANTTITLAGNITIVAVFEKIVPTTYAFSKGVLDNVGGTVTGTADGNYAPGTAITVTASPDEGYFLDYWWDTVQSVSPNNPYTFLMPQNDVRMEAAFNVASTVRRVTLMSGSTTNCNVVRQLTFKAEESINGAPYSLMHNGVVHFGGQSANINSSGIALIDVNLSPYTSGVAVKPELRINGTLVAVEGFVRITACEQVYYSFYAENLDDLLGNKGTITGTASGTNHLALEHISVTATAKSGYRFINWIASGTGEVLSSNATYEFNMPNRNVYIYAVFESIVIVPDLRLTFQSGNTDNCADETILVFKVEEKADNTYIPLQGATVVFTGISKMSDSIGEVEYILSLSSFTPGTILRPTLVYGSNTYTNMGAVTVTACKTLRIVPNPLNDYSNCYAEESWMFTVQEQVNGSWIPVPMATMSYLKGNRTYSATTNSFGILEIENGVVDEIPGTVINLNLQINGKYYPGVGSFTVAACEEEIFSASPIEAILNCPLPSNFRFHVGSNINASTTGKIFSIDAIKGSTAVGDRVSAVVDALNVANFGNLYLSSYADYDEVNMYIRDSENPIEDVLIGTFRVEECVSETTLSGQYPAVTRKLLFRINDQAPIASFAIVNYLDISPYVSSIVWLDDTVTSSIGAYTWRYKITYTDGSFSTAGIDVVVQNTPVAVESLVMNLNDSLPNPIQGIQNIGDLYDIRSVSWQSVYATNVAGIFTWVAVIDYNFNRPGYAFNDRIDVTVKVGISARTFITGINQSLTVGDPMPALTSCVSGYTVGTITWMGSYNTATAGTFLWDIKVTYSDTSYNIVSIQVIIVDNVVQNNILSIQYGDILATQDNLSASLTWPVQDTLEFQIIVEAFYKISGASLGTNTYNVTIASGTTTGYKYTGVTNIPVSWVSPDICISLTAKNFVYKDGDLGYASLTHYHCLDIAPVNEELMIEYSEGILQLATTISTTLLD